MFLGFPVWGSHSNPFSLSSCICRRPEVSGDVEIEATHPDFLVYNWATVEDLYRIKIRIMEKKMETTI